MKSFLCILLCLLATHISHAQDLEWAKNIGNMTNIQVEDVKVGASGNSYYTGVFNGTLDMDPGAAIYNLNGSNYDVFVLKLDMAGNFVWAKVLCSTPGFTVHLELDEVENIYLAGNFINTSDFDPGIGVFNLTASGGTDIFVAKLDSAGNFGWAKQVGAGGADHCTSIALDDSSDICVVGTYAGTVDFDPGNGVSDLVGDGIFVLKLDKNGDFKWAQKLNVTSSSDNDADCVAVDIFRNVFVSGHINDIMTLFKLDSLGNLLWTKQINGAHGGYMHVISDDNGNIYNYGVLASTGDFDFGPGTHTITPSIYNSNFLLKTDNSGNFLWVKEIGVGPGSAGDIALDENGGIYYTGLFAYFADLDPGTGTYTVQAQPGSKTDAFVVKLNSSGTFMYGIQLGSVGDDGGYALDVGPGGELFLTGTFQNTVDFDPGSGVYNLTASNQTSSQKDVYFLKLSSTLGVSEINRQAPSVIIYPDPTTGSFFVNSSVTINALQVTDMLGRIVYSATPGKQQCQVSLSAPSGIYQVIILSGGERIAKKLVIE